MLQFRGVVQFFGIVEANQTRDGKRTIYKFLVVRSRQKDSPIPKTGLPFDGYIITCITHADLSEMKPGTLMELTGEIRGTANSKMRTMKNWFSDLCVDYRNIRVLGETGINLNIPAHIKTYGTSRKGEERV